jgi:DNA polymerase-3 subunit epsilon
MKFAAIDFETANQADQSICAVGLSVFVDGASTNSRYWLIRPPKGYGWFQDDFINIHGIRHTDVQNQPEFPAVAPELFTRLAAADIVVAHNAQFDMRKLIGTAAHFGLKVPPIDCICTMALARRVWPELDGYALNSLAERIGHQFQHHHAAADAEAAGWLLLAMMREKGAPSPRRLAEMLGMRTITVRGTP